MKLLRPPIDDPELQVREAHQPVAARHLRHPHRLALGVLFTNTNSPPHLIRRDRPPLRDPQAELRRWLRVAPRQEGSNRNAVGAWIEVRAGGRVQRREVVVGGGHVSGQSGWHHFGLGPAPEAEVRIQWPDGIWSPWRPTPADRFLVFERAVLAPR